MKIFTTFALITLVLVSCTKGKSGCYNGELKNLTGFDGCGWLIELDNGTKLDPINLHEFEDSPLEGQKVCVQYKTLNSGSVCMVGTVVELESLE